MTTKKIKSSDILGDNYYVYNLTSSNYTPNLNVSITITCTVKNVYGNVVINKSVQLYQNDVAVGNTATTNNNGVATWTITCSTAGVQKFSVKDAAIEVFVDTTSKTGHNHTTSDITNFPEIPTKTSDLTNDSNFLTSHQSLTNYIQKSNTNGLIKNDGTIDTNTYLTTHQDISNKVNTSDLGETAFSNDYNDLDNLPTIPSAYTHPSTHSSSMITDSNTHSNIGNTANTLENIITNIDTKLGSLANVDLIEVISSLGTASANTMNKLYLVAETTGATNDNYEVFVTVRTGTSGNYSYNWEKVDTARIDLSDYLTTTNAQQTYVTKENGKGLSSNDYTTTEKNKLAGLHTVATSGSYNDLTNKPTIPTVPTNVSSFTNDSGYLTSHQDISGKENISNKSSSITTDTGSTSKYPTVKAVEDYAEKKTTPINFGTGPSSVGTLFYTLSHATTGTVIELENDYIFTTSSSSININKTITIKGNGHTFDLNNKEFTFKMQDNGVLKIIDCNFINFNISTSTRSLFNFLSIPDSPNNKGKLILNNCSFKNGTVNKGYIMGNASLGTCGEVEMNHCYFYNNTNTNSGRIYYSKDSNFKILNTVFEENTLPPIYIDNSSTFYNTITTQLIKNCIFNNNVQAVYDRSSNSYKKLVLVNNLFLQSGDTLYGCTNNNYLTDVDITDLNNISYDTWQINYTDNTSTTVKILKYTGS